MGLPSWFLDELAHAGSEHLDTTYVPTYDRKAGTDPSGDLAVLRELGLNETHTLVDLGAGTGSLVLAAAPLCRRVVAVDVSPVMVAFLREKALQENQNIACVQAGFLSYEHAGELSDFVYTRHALHHLPDFWKALALQRMAAMLKVGGILFLRDLIFSCALPEVDSIVEAWLAGASKVAGIGWTRPELETHLRTEYSTFSWLLEPMIEQAGFKIQTAQHHSSKLYSAYTCVKVK